MERVKIGAAVRVHSLVGRPEFNGAVGVVCTAPSASGRVGVQITADYTQRPLSIKLGNLELIDVIDVSDKEEISIHLEANSLLLSITQHPHLLSSLLLAMPALSIAGVLATSKATRCEVEVLLPMVMLSLIHI